MCLVAVRLILGMHRSNTEYCYRSNAGWNYSLGYQNVENLLSVLIRQSFIPFLFLWPHWATCRKESWAWLLDVLRERSACSWGYESAAVLPTWQFSNSPWGHFLSNASSDKSTLLIQVLLETFLAFWRLTLKHVSFCHSYCSQQTAGADLSPCSATK